MSYSIKDFKRQLADGLLDKNPVLAQMLGMCSTLAVTTSIANAVGMGLAVTAVLACSNVFISLLRKIIPQQIRIASYIVIISGFVTAVQLLIQAFLPELDRTLGLFIPLIVVNCIILARAESFASKNPVLPSAVDGVVMGIGYTVALILLAAIRELLGAGTLLGYPRHARFVRAGYNLHPAVGRVPDARIFDRGGELHRRKAPSARREGGRR